MTDPKGLYGKFLVFKNEYGDVVGRDQEPLDGCFVLRPEKDKAARRALEEYAARTDDRRLAADLQAWIDRLDQEKPL